MEYKYVALYEAKYPVIDNMAERFLSCGDPRGVPSNSRRYTETVE